MAVTEPSRDLREGFLSFMGVCVKITLRKMVKGQSAWRIQILISCQKNSLCWLI